MALRKEIAEAKQVAKELVMIAKKYEEMAKDVPTNKTDADQTETSVLCNSCLLYASFY